MNHPASSKVPKAYSYMRFSTLEQGKGDSLNRQTMMAREWSEKHGVPLDTELTRASSGRRRKSSHVCGHRG
jgi:DNA invertase Pin-like site-specific DNA recombinase